MTCTVDQRQSIERAARALRGLPPVIDVDTLPPAKSQYDAWTVDAVVRCPDGIPPSVSREIAIAGLYQQEQPRRGDIHSVVATA